MPKVLLFILVLVAGLAVLALAAAEIVGDQTRAWFDKDMSLRARLALQSARRTFVEHWGSADSAEMDALLAEIAADERIRGVLACSPDLTWRAATADFPDGISCDEIGAELRSAADRTGGEWIAIDTALEVKDARLHVSAMPLNHAGSLLGWVVLVHDTAFIERRMAAVQQFILVAFGVLTAAASLITIVASRLFWQGWTRQIRRFLREGDPPRGFQPILQDVRDLINRISSERALDDMSGTWTPARLKQTLTQHVEGQRIVILSNREPYIHTGGGTEPVRVLHPASGLVTALEPVMRACGGVWVAHGSGSADRQTVDARNRIRVPPGEESYTIRRVWISPEEEQGYYYGFSNEGLWPLCHIAHTRPMFRKDDWQHYVAVNRTFADTVCSEVDSDDPIILVQDYHFAMAPRMIRDRLPRATIISFWHIPWPNAERFGICPWGEDLLQGLLGSSILGFHTQLHCNNFLDAADRFLEARIDRERNAVFQQRRSTLVRPYPISVEWPNHWAAALPPVAECRAAVFRELGLREDALLGVGVDRLDYTKGIQDRLLAVERFLERYPQFVGRFTFVQLSAPSRTLLDAYRRLNEDIEQLAQRINSRFASGAYRSIILHHAHHEPPAVFRSLRAANLCYVSSLHDGMNLVAKEFVAARDDERGVLILSHFTGASRELTEALIVNPYDLDEASDAMAAALRMPLEEQRARMRAMRAMVAEFNVYRWAGRMLIDATQLRNRDRLQERLGDDPSGAAASPVSGR